MLSGAIVASVGFLAAFAITDALTGEAEDDATTAAAGTTNSTPAPSRPVIVTVAQAPPTEATQEEAPIDPDRERRRAPCPVRDFRLVFDRESGAAALFANDGRPLASIGLSSHRFEPQLCPPAAATGKPYAESDRPSTYESGSIACTTSREIDVEIHPTVDPAGRQVGNVLLVSEQGRAELLVSAVVVEGLQGRRVYYSDAHCDLL